MERNEDKAERVIELGIASSATLGPIGDMIEAGGLWHRDGLEQD